MNLGPVFMAGRGRGRAYGSMVGNMEIWAGWLDG